MYKAECPEPGHRPIGQRSRKSEKQRVQMTEPPLRLSGPWRGRRARRMRCCVSVWWTTQPGPTYGPYEVAATASPGTTCHRPSFLWHWLTLLPKLHVTSCDAFYNWKLVFLNPLSPFHSSPARLPSGNQRFAVCMCVSSFCFCSVRSFCLSDSTCKWNHETCLSLSYSTSHHTPSLCRYTASVSTHVSLPYTHVFGIGNNVAVNTGVHVSFKLLFLFSTDNYPDMELPGCTVVLFLIFDESPFWFPQWLPNLYSLQQCTRALFSPHPRHLLSFCWRPFWQV